MDAELQMALGEVNLEDTTENGNDPVAETEPVDDDILLNDPGTAPLIEEDSELNQFQNYGGGSDNCCGNSCTVFVSSLVAAFGGLLFGYDVGIISGALLLLKYDFSMTCTQQEHVVSAMLVGALFGAVFGGFFVDYFGRKRTILINALIFVLGAVLLAVSPNYEILICGRIVIGVSVAVSAIAECVYISEIAPSEKRGSLVTLNELAITIGFLFAYLLGYLFINTHEGWRWMFGLSGIPALFQAIFMLFLPESPRFFMLKKKESLARAALNRVRPLGQVTHELKLMKLTLETEKSQGVADLFRATDNMRGRLFCGMGLVLFQQLSAQPSVLYYAPTVFQAVGFSSNLSATMNTLALGIIKVLATGWSLLFLDRWGRRKFLISGTILMGFGIVSLAIVLSSLSITTVQSDLCHDFSSKTNFSITNVTTMANTSHEQLSLFWKGIILASLMTYVAGYSIGFGPVTWLILSEIFPASIKGRAISLATILNWIVNLLISSLFLEFLTAMGISLTFLLIGATCFLASIFVFLFIPETKNLSLERINVYFNKTTAKQRALNNLNWCSMLVIGRRFFHGNYERYDIRYSAVSANTVLISHETRPNENSLLS